MKPLSRCQALYVYHTFQAVAEEKLFQIIILSFIIFKFICYNYEITALIFTNH